MKKPHRTRKPKAKRNTLAQQIKRELPDSKSAYRLARYGKKLSPTEEALSEYSFWNEWDKESDETRASAERLCKIFLASLHEQSARQKFAAELYRFQDDGGDQLRAHIIGLKVIFERRRERIPISRLAKILKCPATDDGYSALRRLAKELKFPIADGKTDKHT